MFNVYLVLQYKVMDICRESLWSVDSLNYSKTCVGSAPCYKFTAGLLLSKHGDALSYF